MKNTLKLVALIGAMAVFSACGQSNKEQGEIAQSDHTQMGSHQSDQAPMKSGNADHVNMDHSQMGHSKMDGDAGHTTGKILSISAESQEITIDHEKMEGFEMGAMTMGYSVLLGVNLDDYAPNDNVSFMVTKGHGGSYSIPAMCNTDKDGADCLDEHKKHDGHQ